MWRFIYRKVNGRPGNSSLRLGQIQAAEKNEDKNSSFPEENDKGPLQSRRYHGKALLVTEAKKCGEQEMEHFKSSYDLVRCILNNIQNAQKNRTIFFSNCFARGKEEENSNPFHGELRLEMVKPSGMSTSNQVNQENQGIPRCASSPVILDQPDIEQQSAPSNTSNALLAF